jgi:hypothetical protein
MPAAGTPRHELGSAGRGGFTRQSGLLGLINSLTGLPASMRPRSFNGSQGTLEVLVHEASGQIRHVLFRSGVAP